MISNKKKQYLINTASGVVGQSVRIGVGLVLLPYLLWRLGPEAYGVSQLAQSVLAFFGFLQLGMGPTLVRFCSQAIAQKDRDEIRKISSTAQAILGGLGLIGMLGIIGFMPFFLKFYEVPEKLTFDVSCFLVCMGISFLVTFISVVPNGLSLGSNRYDLVNGANMVANLLRLGLIVLVFELMGPSILLLGICILLSQAFRCVALLTIALVYVGRSSFFSFRAVNRETLKALFGFSILSLTNTIAVALVIQGPVLVIGKTLGAEAVAMFAPVITVASAMQGFLGNVSMPLVPLASQAKAEGNPQKLGRWAIEIGSCVVVVGLAIALPLSLFGPEIIELWLGAKMTPIWSAIAVVAVGVAVSQSAGINYSLSLGGGHIQPVVYSQMVLGVVVTIGVAIGTMYLGWHLLGVAVFITICRCFRNMFYLTYAYSRQFFYSVSRYVWFVYAKPLLVFMGIVGIGGVTRIFVCPDQLVLFGVEMAVMLIVYFAAAWCFVIDVEVKDSVRKMLFAFRKN